MRHSAALDVLESSARAGTWSLDLGTDELWWSPGIYAILRLDAEAYRPTVSATLAFYVPESRRRLEQALARAHAEGVGWDLELELVRADGQPCAIHMVAEPVQRDGEVAALAGAFFDIDQRRRERQANHAMARRVQEQEARWQFATRASGLGMWDWDLTADRAQYSEQWKALLGYEPDEIGDSPAEWRDRVHPDDVLAHREALRAHLAGETGLYASEHRLRCNGGEYRWMQDRGQVVERDAAGRPRRIIGTQCDIHARRCAEAELARSERRFRAIFNSMFQFTGLMSPDGTLIEANEIALTFAGVAREDVVDRPVWEGPWFSYSPRLQTQLRDAVARARAGEFMRFNVDIVGGDGQRLTIDFSITPFRDESGEIALLIPEGRDITELLAAQTALRASERRFHQVFDQAPIGLGLVGLEGRWRSVNRELLDILGYSESELLARTIHEVTHPDDLETSKACFAEALAGGRQAYRLEKRYVHRDGRAIEVQVDASLLRDEHGEPLHFIGQVQDITQRNADRAELFEAKELAQVTLAAIGEGLIRVDQQGRITLCNRAASELLGCDEQAMVGVPFAARVRLLESESERPVPSPVAQALRTGGNVRGSVFTRLRRADGSDLPIAHSTSPIRDREGHTIGAVFVFQDVSETQRMTSELASQARRDDLTNLPNRRSFEEALDECWRSACAGEGPYYVMYLDLDQFKTVNDTCGHLVGDVLLREVAGLLRTRLRCGDRLFRLGGDEFAAIVEADRLAVAEGIADKLIEAVAGYEFRHSGRGYRVGLSIGLARVEREAQGPVHVQARADTALYVAKETGRRRRHSYRDGDPEIQQARQALDIAQRIQLALERDGFELHLQAIVDEHRHVRGYEALVRLRQDDGELLSPGRFLPTAKRIGLVGRVDAWVARAALGLVRRRQRAGLWPEGCYVTINLSAHSASDPLFRQTLLELLETYRTPVDAVRFEITETEELRRHVHPGLIEALRARRYRVWVDDFGSGFSSFELLKRFHVDGIKIDRSFCANPAGDPVDRALVESAIQLGAELGMEVVAEGVETEACLAGLQRLAITRYQGYLFHRPQPADEALAAAAPGLPLTALG